MIAQSHYIAIPKSGSGPGVVILHSWWGLNAFFKGLCDRLAEAGFVALAPDLYNGKVASTVEAARKLRAQATASRREPAYKTLMAAINSLSRHEAVTTPAVAVAGFSMGGHWAVWLAQRPELPIAATGKHKGQVYILDRLSCPLGRQLGMKLLLSPLSR
jgi:carboxymethylenebutenolidase